MTSLIKQQLVRKTLDYVLQDPENNMEQAVRVAESLAIVPWHKEQVQAVAQYVNDEDNIWRQFVLDTIDEVDHGVIRRMVENFFVNGFFDGVPKQHAMEKKLDVNVPYAMLIDLTSACNLRCTGCWAGDYSKADNLPLEVVDRLITEGKELGIYWIVLSGGEPLVRKDDIIELARRHSDVVFLAFTNGTMVDEDFAEQMREAGNISLAFSLEGLQASTDNRRGEGVFNKVMRAMDICREHGLVYGCSTCYTRHNVDEVGSDEYLDLLIDKGCRFLWYFTYVPVGVDCDLDLMATPEQRAMMYRRTQEIRLTKPIFALDFWNDGPYSGGCIAGAKRYFHINAAGWAEPCAFIHYANVNVKDKSLQEILRSPLFKAYRKRMPFNENHLRPCPLIDNPQMLREMVQESGARSTQESEDKGDVVALTERLADYATAWGETADELWVERQAKYQKK